MRQRWRNRAVFIVELKQQHKSWGNREKDILDTLTGCQDSSSKKTSDSVRKLLSINFWDDDLVSSQESWMSKEEEEEEATLQRQLTQESHVFSCFRSSRKEMLWCRWCLQSSVFCLCFQTIRESMVTFFHSWMYTTSVKDPLSGLHVLLLTEERRVWRRFQDRQANECLHTLQRRFFFRKEEHHLHRS